MKLKYCVLNLAGIGFIAIAALAAICVTPKPTAFIISLVTLVIGMVCFDYADRI